MEESTREQAPLSLLEDARLRIAHLKLDQSEDLWRAMCASARVSATSLGVRRVGVWFLSADRLSLHRIVVFDETDGTAEATPSCAWSGDAAALSIHGWSTYLEAIMSRRVVAADDAWNDPRTRELGPEYLSKYGIASLLDVPLFLGGEVWGIVCHEHAGTVRHWTDREIDFAVSVADMLSALLEQSKRLRAEKRLRHDDALAADAHHTQVLSRTAAGIGHDVNTVLHAITSNAQRASHETEPSARAAALPEILADCQRGARIVVDDIESTLKALLGESYTLVTELAHGALVTASRTDIERVLLNLVINARDAMPNGGAVSVSVSVAGDHVKLAVRDAGVGIAEGDLDQIFEPYFTTKPARNTGLGLFAVRAIAQRTNGDVSASSAPGVGTTMTVSWPLALDD